MMTLARVVSAGRGAEESSWWRREAGGCSVQGNGISSDSRSQMQLLPRRAARQQYNSSDTKITPHQEEINAK